MFGARHDSSCFSSRLLWVLLLADSIIFQLTNKPEKKLKTQKRATNFLNPPTEKSFNRGQNPRPKGKT